MSILLATLNARYAHAAFGLRYLLANMGDLRPQTQLCEFTIQHPTLEIVADILSHDPQIVGFGVYIWNVAETTRVITNLKKLRPDIVVVIGGPEVSYEIEDQEICRLADHVITGEADLAFADLCRARLAGQAPPHVVSAPLPDLNTIALPYDLYSDDDLAHRVIYVEASRGCPFTCEFCLSALDIPVRQFPLDRFLASLRCLLERGVRQFKFVDRTFNLNLKTSRAILEFFLGWTSETPLFLHFEMIPDRLPEALKQLIVQFPPGALQFEIGIQTFNESVGELISRKQDNHLAEDNIRWLRSETGVHLHTDLIVGLPGESIESFAAGFDRLVALGPQEIQVGILKRLRGTPISRHDAEWGMVYSPHPPYEILQTKLIDFSTLQELRRFAKVWDLVANSGNFVETMPLLLGSTPFARFRRFSAWLFEQTGQTYGLPLTRLVELVFRYLTERQSAAPEILAPILLRDYHRGGRSDLPSCLREWVNRDDIVFPRQSSSRALPARQRRHQ
ncbi:MAG: DUF4080 domain-containing protein [Planctomycetaceae bacterium]